MSSEPSPVNPTTKKFFILRATKVFGPFTARQIEKGKLDGKFLPSDQISTLANGPWQDLSTAQLETHPETSTKPKDSNEVVTAELVEPETVEAEVVTARIMSPSLPMNPSITPALYPTWTFVAVMAGSGVAALFGFVLFVSWLLSGPNDAEQAATEAAITQIASANEALASDLISSDTTSTESSSDSEITTTPEDIERLNKVLAEFEQTVAEIRGDSATQTDAGSSYTPPAITDDYSELADSLLALGPDEACEHASAMIADKNSTDLRTAYLLLDKAAKTGHVRSAFLVGLCYFAGWGVVVDETAGRYWVEHAALNAEPEAMFLYAGMIQEGQYPEKGNSDCLYWLNRSAETGYRPAQDALNEYKLQQLNGLIGAMVLSAFSSGESSSASDEADAQQQAYWERMRERDYWKTRAEHAAANGDQYDYDYSRRMIP